MPTKIKKERKNKKHIEEGFKILNLETEEKRRKLDFNYNYTYSNDEVDCNNKKNNRYSIIEIK